MPYGIGVVEVQMIASAKRWVAAGATGALLSAMTFLYPIEGEVRHVYKDIGGVATVCVGSTQFVKGKQSFTEDECTELFRRDAQKHLEHVQSTAPENTPESVLAAMTSVSYNVGMQGYTVSPMRKLVQAGAFKQACDAITAPWVTSKGVAKGYRATVNRVPVRGLENRRAKERQLCLSFLSE